MDAKHYLEQIKMLDAKINQSIEEIEHLKSIVYKVTPSIRPDAGGGHSSDQDKIGSAVAKIIDLEAKINADIDRYVDLKRKIMRTLEKITDPFQFQVLHKRYFLYKSFDDIADEINMSRRNTLYIHGDGLKALNKILNGGKQ